MRPPCSTHGCFGLANAAGRYCDRCDASGLPDGWSRTRDDAWLAYVDCEGIRLIPLPRGMDYEAAQKRVGTLGQAEGSRPRVNRNPKEGNQNEQQQH